MGMIRAGLSEAWLVVDDAFIHRYGLGLVLPGGRRLHRAQRQGYIISAADAAWLARRIGVDARGLSASIALANGFAQGGTDPEFGRGTLVMNRSNGDPVVAGNPCLGPITQAPLHALRVVAVDLAGSGGLRCDAEGRALDAEGQPIPGLHACGNDADSIFRDPYPGPGTTIGPAMVFGWRIARSLAASD